MSRVPLCEHGIIIGSINPCEECEKDKKMNNKEVESYMDKINPESREIKEMDELTRTRLRINSHAKSIMFMYKSYASNNPPNDPWHNRIEKQMLRDCLQSMHYHKLINDYHLGEYYFIDRCGNKVDLSKSI